MKRGFSRMAALAVGLLILCSCGTPGSRTNAPVKEEQKEIAPILFSPQTALPKFQYTNAVLAGDTAFLCGSGNGEHVLLRADPTTGQTGRIELPSSEKVFCLGAANNSLCLAVTDSSRLDPAGTPKDHFTLFEINENGDIFRETPLDGVDKLNLLAIGTPTVQGCALLGENILLLINNRLILLNADGEWLDDLMWRGTPRLAGGDGSVIWLVDMSEDTLLCAVLSVSPEGKLRVEKRDLPEGSQTFVHAFGQKDLFYTVGRQVFAMNYASGKVEERWCCSSPPSGSKEFWFNGEDLLLELENGRVRFLRIAETSVN